MTANPFAATRRRPGPRCRSTTTSGGRASTCARPSRSDRAALRALQPAGAAGLRRPVEEPAGRAHRAAAARRWRARCGWRRIATRCSPASPSTRPKTARCKQLAAAPAPRGRRATRTAVATCTRRWMPCSPTPRRVRGDAGASPTSSTSASAAPTSGRRWRCWRWRSSRMPGKRFHFVSNVDGHELARVLRSV